MYTFKWPLLQSVLTEINIDLEYEVLIEIDIPLLYITKSDNQYFLHYLIDEDRDLKKLRYLYIPISKMKIRALVTNGITLFNCIDTDNLHIYDLDLDDNILFIARIDYNKIDLDALPKKDSLLPPMSQGIIDKLYGVENNKELVFILEGDKVNQHTIPFNDLSTYLVRTQHVVTDAASYYYDENDMGVPINSELRVVSTNAASFAINSRAIDKNTLKAIEEVIPKYTEIFINSDKEIIYEILDTLPTKLSQSLFDYYKFILNNDYESIIKIKTKSVYLNKDYVKIIKANINGADYIREETITKVGYLVGGNINTKSFYFLNKEDNKAIRGHFSKDYIDTHSSTLILDNKKIWKAKFKLSIQYKFSDFKKTYELLELIEVTKN
ncbi:MAG: hypothetical protein LGB70_04380 [Sulfurovum sp.]|nr:hypothetical protein [Sulfurovum sp.]